MKKFLILAASAAVLLTGCQKNEPVVQDDSLQEISFSGYSGREVTKADPTTLNSGTFNVAAYWRTGSSATTHSSYFASQAYTGTSGSFTSSPVHYWPVESGVVLDFYAAYEPGKTTSITAGETYEMTASTGDVDFMAATLEKQSKGTMTLAFGHKLTKVSFKVKGDVAGLKYVISDLTMKANSKATYKWFSSTASEQNTWTSATTSKSDYDFVTSDVTITQSGTTYTSIPTVKYLIPSQPTSANTVTMTIKYKIYADDGTTVLDDKSSGVTIDLTGTIGTNWGINKSVVYNISLNASSSGHPIDFTATLGDWTTVSEQSVNVN